MIVLNLYRYTVNEAGELSSHLMQLPDAVCNASLMLWNFGNVKSSANINRKQFEELNSYTSDYIIASCVDTLTTQQINIIIDRINITNNSVEVTGFDCKALLNREVFLDFTQKGKEVPTFKTLILEIEKYLKSGLQLDQFFTKFVTFKTDVEDYNICDIVDIAHTCNSWNIWSLLQPVLTYLNIYLQAKVENNGNVIIEILKSEPTAPIYTLNEITDNLTIEIFEPKYSVAKAMIAWESLQKKKEEYNEGMFYLLVNEGKINPAEFVEIYKVGARVVVPVYPYTGGPEKGDKIIRERVIVNLFGESEDDAIKNPKNYDDLELGNYYIDENTNTLGGYSYGPSRVEVYLETGKWYVKEYEETAFYPRPSDLKSSMYVVHNEKIEKLENANQLANIKKPIAVKHFIAKTLQEAQTQAISALSDNLFRLRVKYAQNIENKANETVATVGEFGKIYANNKFQNLPITEMQTISNHGHFINTFTFGSYLKELDEILKI